jgi:O-antigen ligase
VAENWTCAQDELNRSIRVDAFGYRWRNPNYAPVLLQPQPLRTEIYAGESTLSLILLLTQEVCMEALRENTRGQAPNVLMALLLSAPLLAIPDNGGWQGMRPLLIQAVAFGSLALLLARVRWSFEGLRSFLTTGPNLALVLFLGWTALSFAITAPVVGRGRSIALAELMRLASGVAIYFAVAYRCNSRHHLKVTVLLLLVGGVLASAAGMLSGGMSKSGLVTAAYGNKQLLGAFLVLLLPVAVVFAQSGEKFSRPLFATTAALRCLLATVGTVMLVATLLLTNNRSSWLGSVVGLLVVSVLLFSSRKRREATARKRHWIASAVVALASVVLCLTLLGTESGVLERAKTLTTPTQVPSFQQRLQLWSICEQMILDRPVMGLGVGSFPMKAGDYSWAIADRKDEQTVIASGAETIGVPLATQVEKDGASLSSLPHNEYLQLGAELGLVGLALYVAVLVGFFYRGIMALPHVAKISRTRKLVLIASMGAIAAQCVDAIGNPAWRFGDVSPLFWLMLGLGMAATHRQRQAGVTEDLAQTPRLLRFGFDRLGWRMSAVLVLALVIPSFAGAQAGSPQSCYCLTPLLIGGASVGILVVGIPVVSGRSEPKTESDSEPTSESLDISGPVFPAILNMSNFSVVGFVNGGWPIVIEYELEADSTAAATISTRDGKHSPLVIELPSTNDQPKEIIRHLPAEFGQEPVVGVLSFTAVKNGPEPKKPARFFLSGLGLGPHAVGSVVIDRLQCQPSPIHPKRQEGALYSFHSLSDIDRVNADFRLGTYSKSAGYGSRVVFSEHLPNGIRQDRSVTRNWNGKSNKGQIVPGSYQFYVSGWDLSKDWGFAAKDQAVRVE